MATGPAASDELLDDLVTGRDDIQLLQHLVKGQLGKRILQLGRIAGHIVSTNHTSPTTTESGQHYALLAAVQRHSPQILTDILLDPDVAVWLADSTAQRVDLGPIAAAAAIRSRMAATVSVRVQGRELFLPTLGTAILQEGGCDTATLIIEPDGTRIEACSALVALPEDLRSASAVWRPVLRMEFGTATRLRVLVGVASPVSKAFSRLLAAADDIDVKPEGHVDWQRSLADGWQVLQRHHPLSAKAIAHGLRTVVPVFAPHGHSNESATLNGIFGAVLLGFPSRPVMIACNLVHEFQHAKLSAMQDLVTLHAADCDHTYYAPWRYDPRPLPAALQGVYAHLGVTQFWAAQRTAGPAGSVLADVEFARWRQDTLWACDSIRNDGHLTSTGARFVNAIMTRLTDLCSQELPSTAVATAVRITHDHELLWRLQNRELDSADAVRWARAWLDHRPAALHRQSPGSVRRRQTPPAVAGRRIPMTYRTLGLGADRPTSDNESPADSLYVLGNYHAALSAYADRVTDNPYDLDAWAGIFLSACETGDYTYSSLQAIVEIAPAVYAQATTAADRRDPLALLRWLTHGA